MENKIFTKDLALEVLRRLEVENSNNNVDIELKKPTLDPHLCSVYSKCAPILAKYKSGKMPKALKTLPVLNSWYYFLKLTKPKDWTPHATFQISKIFIASLKPVDLELYLHEIILPKIKDSLEKEKHIPFHLYSCMKEAIYKPASFFKGLVFPLFERDNLFSLKEATIISSIISKVSIPMTHSAVALCKLFQLKYSGPRSIFIKAFLEKRYSLPESVIASALSYFERTKNGTMHVLWYQSLLSLVSIYHTSFGSEFRRVILKLIQDDGHHQIGPEIEQILLSGPPESILK